MSDHIPPELIHEILSRLPAVHLHQLRHVCKAWRDVIDDPAFIRSHLHLQLRNSMSDDGTAQLVFRAHGSNSLCSVSVASLIANTNSESKIKATPLHHYITNPLNHCFMGGGDYRLTSCNGIMFLSRFVGNILSSVVWNPSTGESLELPSHTSTIIASPKYMFVFMNAGFGYDYIHDDFKVVNITLGANSLGSGFESEAMVYSLKSDTWRQLKDFPYIIAKYKRGSFLNGALHWLGSRSRAKLDLIVGIDLGTEDYFEMRFPLEIMSSNNQVKDCGRRVNVLGGCISLICSYPDSSLELWLMKDYKVESSWSKLFSITKWDYKGYNRHIIYSKSRGIVVLQNSKTEYICLDLDKISSPKKVTVDGVVMSASRSDHCTFHLETLVRLKTTNGSRERKRDEEEASV